MSRKSRKWVDVAWVISMGARGGLIIALPVLAGLVGGYLLDRQLGTLPFITLILTVIGSILGPFVLYRWAVSAVEQRMEARKDEEESE